MRYIDSNLIRCNNLSCRFNSRILRMSQCDVFVTNYIMIYEARFEKFLQDHGHSNMFKSRKNISCFLAMES